VDLDRSKIDELSDNQNGHDGEVEESSATDDNDDDNSNPNEDEEAERSSEVSDEGDQDLKDIRLYCVEHRP